MQDHGHVQGYGHGPAKDDGQVKVIVSAQASDMASVLVFYSCLGLGLSHGHGLGFVG